MKKFEQATLIRSDLLTSNVKSLTFLLTKKTRHIPGQYYKFRIETPREIVDRDYSILSISKTGKEIDFAVEKLPGGEMSPYLHKMKLGESIKIKGPLGTHFLLNSKRPTALISSGTGVVPFISFIKSNPNIPYKLLCSFKKKEDILFFEDIKNATITLTRETTKKHSNYNTRIDEEMLRKEFRAFFGIEANFFICGSTSFTQNIEEILVKIGVKEDCIFAERFG